MAASQLWYVPHRPDLLLLAPCDEEGPVPCPGCMYVSVDHLHDRRTAAASGDSDAAPSSSTSAPSSSKWRHPRATAFLTCFGDIGKQAPRVVRCACGEKPCKMRALAEGAGVPDELIPADWATKWELPAAESGAGAGSEGRRTSAVQLWLDCTNRAEKELPRAEGQEHPPEADVLAAAEVMLTDYLKGRVCFHCNVPSTRMQRCGRCMQARYCSRDCQKAHWSAHKKECAEATAAAAAAAAAAKQPASATDAPAEGDAPAPATPATPAAAPEQPGAEAAAQAAEGAGTRGVAADTEAQKAATEVVEPAPAS